MKSERRANQPQPTTGGIWGRKGRGRGRAHFSEARIAATRPSSSSSNSALCRSASCFCVCSIFIRPDHLRVNSEMAFVEREAWSRYLAISAEASPFTGVAWVAASWALRSRT